MKAVSMIVGAFAALAIAAPTTSVVDTTPKELETRAFAFDLNAFNNFGFVNQDLAYLGVLNQIPFQTLYGLAINNGLQLNAFQGLFAQQAQFDIVSLIQLAQLQALGQVANLGVFNAFNLQQFNFVPLDLGLLLQSFNGFNLQQFVGAGIAPQIGAIAKQQEFLNLGGSGAGFDFSNNDNNSNDSGNAVTAEQQEAQEGSSSQSN